MKTFLSTLNQWQKTIKQLFFVTVTVLVVFELFHLSHTVSFDQVHQVITKLPMWHIILMAIIGLVSVTPMLTYDLILNKEMKTSHPQSYILQSSWAINTINNMVGFGGLVDVGLRYSFYARDDKEQRNMQAISKILPYFISGVSVFSIISLMILMGHPSSQTIGHYWIFLLGAAFYLPMVMLLSSRQKWDYFGQLSWTRIAHLIGASVLEWAGILATFLSVGSLMGLHFSYLETIPLFFIAMILGMLSLIPGGLGSFDLIMISGLTSLGIGQSDVLAWLLLYRLFYDIIPFLLGSAVFIKLMGGQVNTKYLGLPQLVLQTVLENTQLFFLRLFGFYLILSALIPSQITGIPILDKLNLIQGQLIWQFPSILLASFFILLARSVRNKVKQTIPFLIGLYLVTLIYINLGDWSLPTSLLMTVIFLSILLRHKNFTRPGFYYAWEDRTKDILLFSLAFMVFLVIFHQTQFHWHFLNHDRHASLEHLFIYWLHLAIAGTIILLAFRSIVNWCQLKQVPIGQDFDVERFSTFLKTYPEVDSESALAFLGDKRLFWYVQNSEDKIVFQFAVRENKCVVMGGPIGDPAYHKLAIQAFIEQAKRVNMAVLFYEVDEKITLDLHDFGYDFMKFGESASVNLPAFTVEGKHGKKFRTSLNKLENKGFRFEVLQPPFNNSFLDQLEIISAQWLNGRQEKGFSLGFFNRDYLQLAPIAVVKNPQEEMIAFVNFLPTNHQHEASIDLMRYNPDTAPNGVMDYLFIKLMLHFKEEGTQHFTLGMAPLSNVGTMDGSFFQEKLAYLVYAFSNRFYSFGGLRHYKDKFHPKWTSKYISYPKKTWIFYNMIALFLIDNKVIDEKTSSPD